MKSGSKTRRGRASLRVLVCTAILAAISMSAFAGGGAENALVIIDPASPESMYVGHYYADARDIPASNILYLSSDAANYAAFVDVQSEAFSGAIANRGLFDHIDYVVVAPGPNYFVSAPGLIRDNCVDVRQFSMSTVYSMHYISDKVLFNNMSSQRSNRYYSVDSSLAFDSGVTWRDGVVQRAPAAERYFIAGMLGYTGERGNTVEELVAMIDRSVAVDGTRPDGTFYFMRTTDSARSGPRHNLFPAAIGAINNAGGQAEQINDVLPIGRHDALGIMTGWANPNIDGADMTIMPGAMCDHLTSFAGRFNTSSQTKMSRWISKGAGGTYGTVEEPCNYSGKFPAPWFHVHYFNGLTLGEAGFRSLGFTPFQVLAYGDPLTQPFAYLPEVTVEGLPEGTVSGEITLRASATTDRPGAAIEAYELLIDGRTFGRPKTNGRFKVDTTQLGDGHHDVRVIAYDDSDVRNQGRWVSGMVTENHGRFVAMTAGPASGDRSTIYNMIVDASATDLAEVVMLANERIIGASATVAATFSAFGETLGAGPVRLQAVARYTDGTTGRSQPITLNIDFSNPPETSDNTTSPVAYGHGMEVLLNRGTPVHFPGFDPDDPNLEIRILAPPSQATLAGTGTSQVLLPNRSATGTDSLTFEVLGNDEPSIPAEISIRYGAFIPCSDVRRFKARCNNGRLRITVRTENPVLHSGQLIQVAIDDDVLDLEIDEDRVRYTEEDFPPGMHVIELVDPAGCVDAQTVECD